MPPKVAPPSSIPKKPESIAPNQTLYIRGLPSANVQKDDLRTALYLLFSTYGPVLDVVALKTMKMRGQAHIVYRDIQTATQAMRALDGFDFLGEEIKISYAKSKSTIVSKLDGTFKLPTVASADTAEMTALQQSIFNAPLPGSTSAAPTATSALPARPQAAAPTSTETAENRGQKRPRDEEDDDDEDSDVAMEEDSDDD